MTISLLLYNKTALTSLACTVLFISLSLALSTFNSFVPKIEFKMMSGGGVKTSA